LCRVHHLVLSLRLRRIWVNRPFVQKAAFWRYTNGFWRKVLDAVENATEDKATDFSVSNQS